MKKRLLAMTLFIFFPVLAPFVLVWEHKTELLDEWAAIARIALGSAPWPGWRQGDE